MLGLSGQVNVIPCQRPQFLGARAGQQRQDDVGVHVRTFCRCKHSPGLGEGQRFRWATRAASWSEAESGDVALHLVARHCSSDRAIQAAMELSQAPGAQDLRLLGKPFINIVSTEITKPSRADSRDQMNSAQDSVGRDRCRITTHKSVREPVIHRVSDGVAARADS